MLLHCILFKQHVISLHLLLYIVRSHRQDQLLQNLGNAALRTYAIKI